MIAALYVAVNGCYFNLPNVDPWDEIRDARTYDGPHRVIAHPPCQRWGTYWFGGPSVKVRKALGDDGGCFEAALASIRTYGGVLEHPADTKAFSHFGLNKPDKLGGWSPAGDGIGYVCHVEQGHYGHRARKATWLYAAHCKMPELLWGPSTASMPIDESFRSTAERRAARAAGQKPVKRMSKKERTATPVQFRDLLISLVSL